MANEIPSVKRVLMIFSNSYNGAYPRDLAHGFFEAGIEIGFISLSKAAVPPWINDYSAKELSSQFGSHVSLARKVLISLSIIKKFKPDVIQTHLFEGGIVGLIAGKILRVPVIHTRHHIDEHYQSGSFLHRWIDRTTAKRSKHVVVCSQAARKWLIEIEGVKKSHITVINQGFDFEYLNPSPESVERAKLDLGFLENDLNIICVARYSRAKGQDYLLYALHDVIKIIPNITLTFMGLGDSKWLEELVSELGLEPFVRTLPSRDDVPACIAAADMIIHPSLADSFSQLLIEAQAVGGLLIASDIAAAREQLIDGLTGVIVPPRNSKEIADAVLYLVRNPELAESMRKNGPGHVREMFTWQRMVNEEISMLNDHALVI